MRKIILLLAFAVLALGGWFLASPWLAMKDLADAAEARDTAQLEAVIDFPVLRENTRAKLREVVRPKGDGVVENIGGAILGPVSDLAVDALVTPEGMAVIITTGTAANTLLPQEQRDEELSWSVEYDGLPRFRGVSTYEDGSPGPVLVFERRGLGWQVVDMVPA